VERTLLSAAFDFVVDVALPLETDQGGDAIGPNREGHDFQSCRYEPAKSTALVAAEKPLNSGVAVEERRFSAA
jgi:hypothetical protein